MAIHPSPNVRDMVYSVMKDVPLLWFMSPHFTVFRENIELKENGAPEAFLYTSRLYRENFQDRCIESMHSLLKASEQGRSSLFQRKSRDR